MLRLGISSAAEKASIQKEMTPGLPFFGVCSWKQLDSGMDPRSVWVVLKSSGVGAPLCTQHDSPNSVLEFQNYSISPF